jgi:hypothetical protein
MHLNQQPLLVKMKMKMMMMIMALLLQQMRMTTRETMMLHPTGKSPNPDLSCSAFDQHAVYALASMRKISLMRQHS